MAALISRRAQLANLDGRFDDAVALMRVARDASHQAADPPTIQAWYEFQTGELFLHRGRLDSAEQHFRRAMGLAADDPRPWLGMGEVAMARGDNAEALIWLQKADDALEDPEVLALLGDMYAAVGKPIEAGKYYDRVEALCNADSLNRRTYRAFLANFYADRGIRLDEALRLIEAELEARQDGHTYETAAWVYHRRGDDERALTLIENALRVGAGDAEMLHRAGAIALAAGQAERGSRWLAEARSINPYYQPPPVISKSGQKP